MPAWPYDDEPPELLPPLLLVGDAQGSLGVGTAVLDGLADPLAVGVGEVQPGQSGHVKNESRAIW